MRASNRFRPVVSDADALESRVTPSAGVRIVAPTIAPLNVSARGVSLTRAAVDQINASFDSFSRDYLQAQGTFFASAGTPDASQAKRFLRGYVVQRIGLLSAELTRTFSHLPQALNRVSTSSPGGSLAVRSFLRSRIDGTSGNTLQVALTSGIPEVTTKNAAATLYTDQALTAIESARATTLNATSFLLRHSFHIGRHA